jgi:hypothetical protein
MKNSIIVFISLLILFYLIGCFIEVSFNIAEWREGVRLSVAGIGTTVSGLFAGSYADANNEL